MEGVVTENPKVSYLYSLVVDSASMKVNAFGQKYASKIRFLINASAIDNSITRLPFYFDRSANTWWFDLESDDGVRFYPAGPPSTFSNYVFRGKPTPSGTCYDPWTSGQSVRASAVQGQLVIDAFSGTATGNFSWSDTWRFQVACQPYEGDKEYFEGIDTASVSVQFKASIPFIPEERDDGQQPRHSPLPFPTPTVYFPSGNPSGGPTDGPGCPSEPCEPPPPPPHPPTPENPQPPDSNPPPPPDPTESNDPNEQPSNTPEECDNVTTQCGGNGPGGDDPDGDDPNGDGPDNPGGDGPDGPDDDDPDGNTPDGNNPDGENPEEDDDDEGGAGGCGKGYIAVETDGNKKCVFCPEEAFDFDEDQKICYTVFPLELTHANPADSLAVRTQINPVKDVVVFSPRDQNNRYQKLRFHVGQGINTGASKGASYVNWHLEVYDKTSVSPGSRVYERLNQRGLPSAPIIFDAWEQGHCLIDGQYAVKLTRSLHLPEELNPKDESLGHIVILSSPPNAETDWQAQENRVLQEDFWVDNTPPVVRDVQITERQVAEKPDKYEIDISFVVTEPQVYRAYGGILQLADVQGGIYPIKVYLDESAYYAAPVVDEDGFWTQGLIYPNISGDHFLWGAPSRLSDYSQRYSVRLYQRLQGHSLEVETIDKAANQARYILYPEGGHF